MKIQEIVLEVVRSRTQPPRNENTRESAEDDLSTNRVTTKKTVIQEVTAEGSGQRNADKSTVVKPANQRMKSQEFEFESQTGSKALGKKKAQVNPFSNSSRFESLKWSRISLRVIPNTKVSKNDRWKINLRERKWEDFLLISLGYY